MVSRSALWLGATSVAIVVAAIVLQTPLGVWLGIRSDCLDWRGPDAVEFLARMKYGVMKKIPASEISREMFLDLVGRGEPFVVEGAFNDWPAMKQITNCSTLRQLYPDLRYHDWQEGTRQSLESVATWRCHAGYLEQDPGVDSEASDTTGMGKEWDNNTNRFKDWLSGLQTPSFMLDDTLAALSSPHHPPMMSGFIGMPGTGVTPHLDENCESFISVQFSGRKRWTVSSPELNETTGRLQWSDPLAVDLVRGDAIVWYMSQMHHTEVLEGCSVSTSLQFSLPAPHIFHERLSRLYRDHDEWRELYQYASAHDVEYFKMCGVAKVGKDVWRIQTGVGA